MSTPPAAGARTSVRVDQELSDDLAVMMRTGMTASDALRHAVSIVAGAYRNAWAAGVVPDKVEPRIVACQIAPSDAPHQGGRTTADTRRDTGPTPGTARRTPVGQRG
ncbi:hypothetical protein [Streptomyces sp. SYSU K21746]